jgi:predicted metal-dependent peptidase
VKDLRETAINRLTAARTRLIMEFPFLGVLALRLPLQAADPAWCPTVATDARFLYYNTAWIISLKEYEVRFAIAHEAMHCALAHFVRRGARNRQRWNLACDLAVNGILVEAGMAQPVEAIYDHRFTRLSAEEIYNALPDQFSGRTLDTHLDTAPDEEQAERGADDNTDARHDAPASDLAARPPPLKQAEMEALARQWKQRMATAAQHALRTSHLSEHMKRLINRLLKPLLPWRAILSPYFLSLARGDYSYERPSRREGEIIFPRLASRGSIVHVVIDSSGSIRKKELSEFIGEVNSLKSIVGVDVTLHVCDMRLSADGPWHFPAWQAMEVPEQLSGGGGTDLRPIFDWLQRHNTRPDLLIYFTDAEGPLPEQPPDFPVIWVIKGSRAVPWGRRIGLN